MFDYSIIGPNDREPAILNASMEIHQHCVYDHHLLHLCLPRHWQGLGSLTHQLLQGLLLRALSRTFVELEYNFLGLLGNLSTTFQGPE